MLTPLYVILGITLPYEHGVDVEITAQLRAYADGDHEALDRVMPFVYEQLRRLAHARLAGERAGHTLDTTGLVHEAYLRMAEITRMEWQNRAHFFAMASTIMRRILVNYALRKKAAKRGGGAIDATMDEERLLPEQQADIILALHEALEEFEQRYPRHGEVVQQRFFGGMTMEEISEALDVSLRTVERDMKFAKAWLSRELKRGIDF